MNKTAWHNLFYSPNESRLRAGWRLIIQLAMLGFLLLFEILAFALANAFFHWKISDTGLFVLSTIFELVAFTASVALVRRFLDKRSFVSLGLQVDKEPVRHLFYGILLALLMIGGVFVTMQRLDWLQIVALPPHIPLLMVNNWQATLYLGIFCVVGFQEELLCRGYLLQTITGGTNIYWGMLISSAIFAALHLGNPGSGWMAMLGIFFAGMLLAFAAVRTGKLWLSIGLHIGWNFFEGVVFGFPTSGVAIYSLIKIHIT